MYVRTFVFDHGCPPAKGEFTEKHQRHACEEVKPQQVFVWIKQTRYKMLISEP